jgi:hypothetical protein
MDETTVSKIIRCRLNIIGHKTSPFCTHLISFNDQIMRFPTVKLAFFHPCNLHPIKVSTCI